jgi:hypothetical protein
MLTLLILILLFVEVVILYTGQRVLFGWCYQLLNPPLAYILVAPGTVLHELSHLLACTVLLVQTGRVDLFHPEKGEDGFINFGQVEHAETSIWRQTIISVAPLLLVPPLLLAISALLLGIDIFSDPLGAIGDSSWWQILVWAYVAISCGTGAFPSSADYIPPVGGAVLLATGLLVALSWPAGLSLAVVVLLLPAGAAATVWLVMRLLMRHKGLKPAPR